LTCNLIEYSRHGQSAALQLIFATLGPFLQPEIWSKNFKKSIQRTIKAEIVILSSLIWNSVALDEIFFSNLARDQKSLATPGIFHYVHGTHCLNK
jgi:hypothetical protein